MELPRGSLDLGAAGDRCLVFLPGFSCPPRAYRAFLAPMVGRVDRIVVPRIGSLVDQVTGRSTPEGEVAVVIGLVDGLRAERTRVWLGGHSRGGLVAWHAAPGARVEGVILVDPVSGGGPPWRPPEPPPAIEPPAPVTIIGFDHGGRCAPEGRNHVRFAAALPSAAHVVVPRCAHADILDGVAGRLGRPTCGRGPQPAAAIEAARRAVIDALGSRGAEGG